jgi:predicted nucleic acid-binding protein
VGFAWPVLLAVLRLTTKPTVFAQPYQPEEALDVVDGWLAQPCATVVNPTVRHAAVFFANGTRRRRRVGSRSGE